MEEVNKCVDVVLRDAVHDFPVIPDELHDHVCRVQADPALGEET